MGHLYISALVALIELLLFRELVRVRYNAHYDTIKDRIPFFRTTQWGWFIVAICYTYADFVSDVLQSNARTHHLISYTQYMSTILFALYSGVFVLTISTLQPGYIKFQMNQLCWTTLVICLTVGQLKYVFHNIYNGLIWFVLPCCLVFTNDIMAYVSGMTWGRKFVHRPFLALSPNKTWEGFLGGWIFTMITAWHLSRVLAQHTWMTCPTNQFTWTPTHLECDLDPIFVAAQSYFPSQIFELLPQGLVKMIPHVVDICSIKDDIDASAVLLLSSSSSSLPLVGGGGDVRLTPCVSGESSHIHHHFELTLRNYYPVQVHALWLGLFASLVAPFGG